MLNKKCTVFGVLTLVTAVTSSATSFQDQHTLQAVAIALKSPIPPELIAQSQKFDDDLLSAGLEDGKSFYLVTDDNLVRVRKLASSILVAAGENPAQWTVRLLDTNPPISNAFVTGGRYIYVYTGLASEASSEDELAFVLAHEVGHALLKHKMRAREDISATIAGLAKLAGLLHKKNKESYESAIKVIQSAYSRDDEREADTMAVLISHKAGFDPVRGVEFFNRSLRKRDEAKASAEKALDTMHTDMQSAQQSCVNFQAQYQSSWTFRIRDNLDKLNQICTDAEHRTNEFRLAVLAHENEVTNQRLESLTSTHPDHQSRIAAVAVVADFTEGRRDLASMSANEAAYRVLAALQEVNSELSPNVKISNAPPVEMGINPIEGTLTNANDLADQLQRLREARDRRLIDSAEYEAKRKSIIERF